MCRQLLLIALTCYSTCLFAQSNQPPANVGATPVEGAIDNVGNAVNDVRATQSLQAQQSTQAGQPNQDLQGNLSTQQQQSGVTSQASSSSGFQSQSTYQQGQPYQQSQSNVQGQTYQQQQAPANAQGQPYQQGQQWQNPQVSSNQWSSNASSNGSGKGTQQPIYVLRHDAMGREFICVNGQAIYFDNANSMVSQNNSLNQGIQHRAGYGNYDSLNNQNARTQNGQSLQGQSQQQSSQPLQDNRLQNRSSDQGQNSQLNQRNFESQTDVNAGTNLSTEAHNRLDVPTPPSSNP